MRERRECALKMVTQEQILYSLHFQHTLDHNRFMDQYCECV